MVVKLGQRATVYTMFAIVVIQTATGNLSQTAVNSMMVGITADLGIDTATGQWLTTIYMLMLGITVPLTAYLSRKMSVRNLTLLACSLFLAGSLLDTLAPEFIMLVAGRFLQAMGTGITLPLLNTLAMTRFPKGQNGTAMGVAGIAMGFAPNIGPVIGGALVGSFGWRMFFVILVSISALLIVATLLFMPKERPDDENATMEWASLVLSTIGFGGVLLGFSNASSMGPASPLVVVPCVVGCFGIVAFVLRQLRLDKPLISMKIFTSRRFTAGFVVQVCLMTSYLGITLIVPLFVQNLQGGTALSAGTVFIPATICALVFNPVGGWCADKFGTRPVVLIGAISMTLGAVAATTMDAATPLWLQTAYQTLRGIGMSLIIGPSTSFALCDLDHNLTVDGSSFIVLVRQACASLGTAMMVLIIAAFAAMGDAAFCYQLAFGFSAVFSTAMLATVVVGVK